LEDLSSYTRYLEARLGFPASVETDEAAISCQKAVIIKGIEKQVYALRLSNKKTVWTASCKGGLAKFAYEGSCAVALYDLIFPNAGNNAGKAKTTKYDLVEFERLLDGTLCGYTRYGTLVASGEVVVKFDRIIGRSLGIIQKVFKRRIVSIYPC
jgi:hypothetical protein